MTVVLQVHGFGLLSLAMRGAVISLQTFSTDNAWQTYIETVPSPCSRALFFISEILFLERYKHNQ